MCRSGCGRLQSRARDGREGGRQAWIFPTIGGVGSKKAMSCSPTVYSAVSGCPADCAHSKRARTSMPPR
jgi:hypothetical protein